MQCENDRLRAQVEQSHDLDKKDVQDSNHVKDPTTRDKGKKPIALNDVDTSVDDELSLGSSLNPYSVKIKRNKDRTRQRHSHRPPFNDSNGGILCQAMNRGQNLLSQAPGKAFILPTGPILVQPVYATFGTRPVHYMPHTTTI